MKHENDGSCNGAARSLAFIFHLLPLSLPYNLSAELTEAYSADAIPCTSDSLGMGENSPRTRPRTSIRFTPIHPIHPIQKEAENRSRTWARTGREQGREQGSDSLRFIRFRGVESWKNLTLEPRTGPRTGPRTRPRTRIRFTSDSLRFKDLYFLSL